MLGFLVLVLIMGVISASTLLSFKTIDEKEKEIQQLSIISSLSLSFNVENFNTQLEVWEYLYDPAEFRLEEFREHREDFNIKLLSLFEAIEQSNIILTPEIHIFTDSKYAQKVLCENIIPHKNFFSLRRSKT